MRSHSRRSFAVEVKSGSRRNATIIPTRSAPAAPAPRPVAAAAPAPAVEKRRILPSLLVPEQPPEAERPRAGPAPEAVAAEPRRRGRPRKVLPAPVAALPPVEPAAAAVVPAPVPAPPPPDRGDAAPVERAAERAVKWSAKPSALAPGERWKRRLGRWSR